ncbi:heavy metal translocating P-type ATPase [Polycladidibacter stylochi]|uniref:heavy metal translocating P-type ATPase n=1 Tax=Polycladidibacter stylochi TaxID=1807766 RepID=UPI0009EB8633|nr:cation-translocating P-type ATPase [Pseudovibrio stylochi]
MTAESKKTSCGCSAHLAKPDINPNSSNDTPQHQSQRDDCCSSQHNHHAHTPTKTGCGCGSANSEEPSLAKDFKQDRSFRVEGLCCAEEVAILKRVLGPLLGSTNYLAFDLLNTKMLLSTEARHISNEAIITAVNATGMKATIFNKQDAQAAQRKQHQQLLYWTTASGVSWLLAIITWLSLHFGTGGFSNGLTTTLTACLDILYLVTIISGGRFVAPKALYAAKTLRPDMNLLMAIAVFGALYIGEWFEGATVAFLFSLSLYLESWSVGRARKAVEALLNIAPSTARKRLPNGTEQEVPVEQIEPDDTFIVRAGDKVPLDGIVEEGLTTINQAPITGESLPIAKDIGDEVFAGTLNCDGTISVRCTKPAGNTLLARITQLVNEAQSRRAASEQWVEEFARIYTPAVMILALLVFLIPPLAFQASWNDWFYRALVLLVISCPCALVISTPVSIVAGLATAARNGVLIKGGVFLELPAKLNALAFDKTGTITSGKPAVTNISSFSSLSENELLALAAALESHSSHPLANAIIEATQQKNISFKSASNTQTFAGLGLRAELGDTPYWLGSPRFATEQGFMTPQLTTQIQNIEAIGQTAVILGNETQVLGFIALADQLRPGTKELIKELHNAGISKLVMLTGDNESTARQIAQQVGIDQVKANLLPEDKLQAVTKLAQDNQYVAMVGDGINDAPAMAQATVSVAMGAIGSDVAIETADIALMNDDLSKLPWLINHSKRTIQIIKQNITIAFIIKATLVVLTAMGLSSLWAAILGDVGATLLVVANAMRLLKNTKAQ